MLAHCNIIAFAATTDPKKAKRFYEEMLGLSLVEESPFALVFDAHGTMLRVQIVKQLDPPNHTVVGWQVADIRDVITHLVSKGVRFERFDGLQQDDLGIWRSPAGAQIAWFKDPDGNILSLTQFS